MLNVIVQLFQKQVFVKRLTTITSLKCGRFQKQLLQRDPVFLYVIYSFSSICGWSLVTLCVLMGFANNSEAAAWSSYKSLASKVDYHKMLSLGNCHKLCKYYVTIFLDLVFPRLGIAMFCKNREGCRCYDSLKLGQTLHKKQSFPLRISSVDMIRSAVSRGFGHIY